MAVRNGGEKGVEPLLDNVVFLCYSYPIMQFENKLIGTAIISRHGETEYTDILPDITEKGQKVAFEAGQFIKQSGILEYRSQILVGHSPKARAKETLIEMIRGAGLTEQDLTWIGAIENLKSSQFTAAGYAVFMEKINAMRANNPIISKIVQDQIGHDYHHDNEFYNNPANIEPKGERRSRTYQELDKFINHSLQNPQESLTPLVLAVSHYETITHFIDDVFGIHTFDSYNTPAFGEYVTFDVISTDSIDKVRLLVN
jgi:broad specificity phosphatase PhoE